MLASEERLRETERGWELGAGGELKCVLQLCRAICTRRCSILLFAGRLRAALSRRRFLRLAVISLLHTLLDGLRSMGRHYCDYCDILLTHDSTSGE